jgi:hypothetical protein
MRPSQPIRNNRMPTPPTDADLEALARVALANVATEYPFHLTHLARDESEVQSPHRLHPAFFGAYDWHSCVHMHWTLARCLRLAPDSALAAPIAEHFDARLTAAAVAAECDYSASRVAARSSARAAGAGCCSCGPNSTWLPRALPAGCRVPTIRCAPAPMATARSHWCLRAGTRSDAGWHR